VGNRAPGFSSLDEGQTSVPAYFPASRWYNYYDGMELATNGQVQLAAPLDYIPLHVHGGNILPTQDPERNTELARNNPFGLIIALDASQSAVGSLFYDDGGDTIDSHEAGNYFLAEYSFSNGTLTGTVAQNGYTGMATKTVDTLRILGHTPFRLMFVNGDPWFDYTVNASTGEVTVLHLFLPMNLPFTVRCEP